MLVTSCILIAVPVLVEKHRLFKTSNSVFGVDGLSSLIQEIIKTFFYMWLS